MAVNVKKQERTGLRETGLAPDLCTRLRRPLLALKNPQVIRRYLARRRLLVHARATLCSSGPGRYSWSSRRCSRANPLSSG